MVKDYSICVATVGQGMFQSPDSGKTWSRIRAPFPLDSRVRGGIVLHPQEPHVVFAGADTGIYRSDDCGQTWERPGGWENLDSPSPGTPIPAGMYAIERENFEGFSMAVDPVDPETIFVGTTPSALFRSRDGGRHWERLEVNLPQDCIIGTARVVGIAVDPQDHRVVWVGVEVGGLFQSLDGGDTWANLELDTPDPDLPGDLPTDIHDVIMWPGKPGAVLVGANRRVFTSADMGESWQTLVKGSTFPLPFTRPLAVKEGDPRVLFLGIGDSSLGATGGLQRSTDGGSIWETLPLPTEPNSPMWSFATNPADPDLILASSHYGEIFTSFDTGDSWQKLKREFSEIQGLAWIPN